MNQKSHQPPSKAPHHKNQNKTDNTDHTPKTQNQASAKAVKNGSSNASENAIDIDQAKNHGHPVTDYLKPKDIFEHDKHYVAIGKIGRSHGLHGMVFVQSYTEPKENIFSYATLTLGNGQPVVFKHHQNHAKQLIAQLEGHQSCDTVKPLTNQLIYLHTKYLPALPSGEYYWHELIGCQVINQDGFRYGAVDYVHAGAQFPILVIKHPDDHRKPETLIPYEPSVVQSVNLNEQTIHVAWITDT